MDSTSYRKIFRDIVVGSSTVSLMGETLYIKHLSAIDQVDIDDIKLKYYDLAIKRGIPSQEDILSNLKSEGIWDDSKDAKIDSQKNFIKQLRITKSQLILKSKIDEQNKTIEQAEKELEELLEEKRSLIGVNADDYSEKRSNDYYIIKSFFKDSSLKDPVFPEEEDFNELYSDQVIKYINVYNNTFSMFEELKIQEMILQDFYYIYFPFSDDTVGFFGNPVCHLTYNQLKLIVYTKIFKNIFENNSHIPEKIKKDPQALLDYGSISDEAKDKMKKQIDNNKDASTFMGATKEDYEYMGIETSQDRATMSLEEAAEKKGGSLSMKDLMELSGHKTK